MESFIEITMILLILSMITEKISNFIKLSFPAIFKDEKNKTIEKKVQVLAIIVGIVFALLSKANIFEMYSEEDFHFFWGLTNGETESEFTISNIFGSLICGFFLSLGSKFFHDLLSLLFETKNLKRKLIQKESWNFHDINDIDEFILENELKAIDIYLKKYFQKFKEVAYFEFKSNLNEVDVNLRSSIENLPKIIPYKTNSGKMMEIKVVKTLRG